MNYNKKIDEISESMLFRLESNQLNNDNLDYTKIEVKTLSVHMDYIINALNNNEIDLRKLKKTKKMWSAEKKSRLIESVFLGLPLPAFYLSESYRDDKLSVIDGFHRLTAIKEFIEDRPESFSLRGMQFLSNLEELHFSDLSRPEIRRFINQPVTIHIVSKHVSDKMKIAIKQRIRNSTRDLSSQEIRYSRYKGVATYFVDHLTELSVFRRATHASLSNKGMLDKTYVTRFLAFYKNYDSYDGEINSFMDEMMETMNRMDLDELHLLERAFWNSLNVCISLFGDFAFRKSYKTDIKKHPISITVFETLSVNIAWLSLTKQNQLIERKEEFLFKWEQLFNYDNEFNNSLDRNSDSTTKVVTRFTKVKTLITDLLHHD